MNARDAAWFDNVWRNIQGLESIYHQALAYLHVFAVGDYVFSFTPETSYLRRPLSEVFTALWRAQRPVMDNGQAQAAFNRDAHDFVRAVKADLLFVRLPRPGGMAMQRMTATGWRETWVRGNDADWERLIAGRDERYAGEVLWCLIIHHLAVENEAAGTQHDALPCSIEPHTTLRRFELGCSCQMPLRDRVNVACARQKERIGRGQPHATSQGVFMIVLFARARLELQCLDAEQPPALIDDELASLGLSM